MSPQLTQIDPTVYLAGPVSALRQLIHLRISNPGAAAPGSIVVSTGKFTSSEMPLGECSTGESHHDVFIGEITSPVDVTFTLKLGESVVDQRVVLWSPPKRWVVHVVQTSHHDLGYTDLASSVLRVHDRWLSDALDMADATAGYPESARFRIVIEQAWSLLHFLRQASADKARRMLDQLRTGQFELNALYGNMTTELCGPEEMIRCLYPAFHLKHEYGIPLISAEHNDITGISWGLCQVLACTSTHARLSPSSSMITVEGNQVVLLAIKQAEDGQGIIVRLWNMGKAQTVATVWLDGAPIDTAFRTNAVEENMEHQGVREGRAHASIDAHGIVTLRILRE